MTPVYIKHYKCDFCKEVFSMEWKCEYHEKTRHKCPNCVHSYYVYGCELTCALENHGKPYRFKKKEGEK